MELIFKLPKGKPPFLGIVFGNLRQAVTLNQDLVNFRKEARYSISLEPGEGTVDLALSSVEPYDARYYRGLACDLKKMETWLLHARKSGSYNFSHLVKELDHEMVVKTLQERKLWVLPVQSLKLAWMD